MGMSLLSRATTLKGRSSCQQMVGVVSQTPLIDSVNNFPSSGQWDWQWVEVHWCVKWHCRRHCRHCNSELTCDGWWSWAKSHSLIIAETLQVCEVWERTQTLQHNFFPHQLSLWWVEEWHVLVENQPMWVDEVARLWTTNNWKSQWQFILTLERLGFQFLFFC